MSARPNGPGPAKQVNLALQGGGAHGAYTWGVLDRLLEHPRIEVEAISGTSAGAMNAAVLAAGLSDGGPAGARARLDAFWERISRLDRFNPVQRNFWDWFIGAYHLDLSPGLAFMESLTRTFSPYQVNPLNFNPLRGVLDELVDFDTLRHASRVKLFISATNVCTGRARIFENREMSAEVLLASACLPSLFQAVEIDGEHYWDGGYMGNPALFPLIYGATSRDIVLVQINPLERPGVPRSARDIQNRINEISFNASLIHEMRAIHFVTRLIKSGELASDSYKHMLIHMIEAEDFLEDFGASS
ncbi:MAG: patatin-like phospholipase family protein, partial [Alphaproteobacteria bacterium]|nr:patatin-like phospholipase family protein [Alphaproteobacteria bacterium]